MKTTFTLLAACAAALILTGASPTPEQALANAPLEQRVSSVERRIEDKGQLERRDLEAQESMAASARGMENLTVVQIVLAALGALGLLATIIYTRNSLTLTRQSLDLTRTALANQQETAERELRAYLACNTASVVRIQTGKSVTVGFETRNYGATPAYDVKIHTGARLCDRHSAFDVPLRRRPTGIVINPTDFNSTTTGTEPGEAGHIPQFQAGLSEVQFRARVDYRDAFNRERSVDAGWVAFEMGGKIVIALAEGTYSST